MCVDRKRMWWCVDGVWTVCGWKTYVDGVLDVF